MSLPAQNPSQSMVATGGQTVFPFTFRCDDSTTIQAWIADAQQGGFAVALNADQVGNPGGTITLPAQAAGAVVTVERVNFQTQTLALTAYNPFTAAALTLALDRMVEMLQEFWAALTRAVRVSRANALKVSTVELPAPVNGLLLGWGDAGGGLSKLVNIFTPLWASGELVTDSGDHIHLTLAFTPTSPVAVYRNGQRIFAPGDFAIAGKAITLVIALGAGEQINADYSY